MCHHDCPMTPTLPNKDTKFEMIKEESKFHALSDEKGKISKKVFKPDSSASRMVNLTTAGQTDFHESSQQTEIDNMDEKWMKKH